MKIKPIDSPQYEGMRRRLSGYIRSGEFHMKHKDTVAPSPGNPCVEGHIFHKECLNTPDRMCN